MTLRERLETLPEGLSTIARVMAGAAAVTAAVSTIGLAHASTNERLAMAYAELDRLDVAVAAEQPLRQQIRQPDMLGWFAQVPASLDGAELRAELLHDETEPQLMFHAELASTAGNEYLELGLTDKPAAGNYTLRLHLTPVSEAPDADATERVIEQSLVLAGDEAMLALALPSDGFMASGLEVVIWAEGEPPSLVQRWLARLPFMTTAQRRSLGAEDALAAPDVANALHACRTGDALVGLPSLQTLQAAMPEEIAMALLASRIECAQRAELHGVASKLAPNMAAGQLPPEPLSRIALGFADVAEGRGNRQAAIHALQALTPVVTPANAARHRDRLALLLLREGRADDARALLDAGPHMDLAEVWSEEGSADATLTFTFLNYGIALARTGAQTQALSVFDLAGQRRTRSALGNALRDQANIMLGWQMLTQRRGSEAAAAFDRVALDGRLTGSALLGRGWAMMAGPSPNTLTRQQVRGLDAGGAPRSALLALHRLQAIGCFELQHFVDTVESGCPDSAAFEQADISVDEGEAIDGAMRYWDQLMARDDRDPMVILGHLAAAEALLLVEQRPRATELLEDALERLDAVDRRLSAADAVLRVQGLPDGRGEGAVVLGDAEVDAAYWLGDWASASQPAQINASLRHLDALALALNALPERDRAERLSSDLEDLRPRFRDLHRELARHALDEIAATYAEYRAAIRLALARVHDATP